MSSLPAMADREDHGFLAIVAVQRNVGSLSEFDDPFPKFGWQFLHGPANLGMCGEDFHSLADGCDGAFGGFLAVRSEKAVKA